MTLLPTKSCFLAQTKEILMFGLQMEMAKELKTALRLIQIQVKRLFSWIWTDLMLGLSTGVSASFLELAEP